MTHPRILHFITPLANVSPFDVNMAADADFVIASYTNIAIDNVPGIDPGRDVLARAGGRAQDLPLHRRA